MKSDRNIKSKYTDDVLRSNQLYTVKVVDVTTRRKTAAIFLEILTDVYHEVERDWNVVVAAITTDASGETRQARREFVREFPSVVVLDCYAHQVSNLIIHL